MKMKRCLEYSNMYLFFPTRRKTNTRARTRARQHSSTSTRYTRARARGGQAVSTSRQQNYERHAKSARHFFNLYVGLHGPGWLYVLGMPPRGYLPFFATVNHQSVCHGPRPGPIPAPWYSGGSPACPGANSTRKDPRPDEQKMSMLKFKHAYTYVL